MLGQFISNGVKPGHDDDNDGNEATAAAHVDPKFPTPTSSSSLSSSTPSSSLSAREREYEKLAKLFLRVAEQFKENRGYSAGFGASDVPGGSSSSKPAAEGLMLTNNRRRHSFNPDFHVAQRLMKPQHKVRHHQKLDESLKAETIMQPRMPNSAIHMPAFPKTGLASFLPGTSAVAPTMTERSRIDGKGLLWRRADVPLKYKVEDTKSPARLVRRIDAFLQTLPSRKTQTQTNVKADQGDDEEFVSESAKNDETPRVPAEANLAARFGLRRTKSRRRHFFR
ncbi:unnamed protein product [Notodromas monacha]|uniref:Uncharacterized protein n=1 Tax=Notodromas monacha TaxID=399045 RepID=A0A7R9BSP8_9CRUS|nr:unnamed protein product [Notodromas monacha]CAG0919977.1 unnamed protein product [Notodromas monacha]